MIVPSVINRNWKIDSTMPDVAEYKMHIFINLIRQMKINLLHFSLLFYDYILCNKTIANKLNEFVQCVCVCVVRERN